MVMDMVRSLQSEGTNPATEFMLGGWDFSNLSKDDMQKMFPNSPLNNEWDIYSKFLPLTQCATL